MINSITTWEGLGGGGGGVGGAQGVGVVRGV